MPKSILKHKKESVNVNLVFILAIVVALSFIGACSARPKTTEVDISKEESLRGCPDGFCNELEMGKGICPEDCSNVEGWHK